MRHRSGQSLGSLWDALGEAWRSASSGSRSVRDLLRGVQWVRRVEVTHGENGWHVHVHALLFVAAGTPPQSIGDAMFAAWSKRLAGLGLAAPLAGPGMQIKLLDVANAADEVADYLAKGHYEAVEPDHRRAAALELASNGKTGRAGNRTPMQILAWKSELPAPRPLDPARDPCQPHDAAQHATGRSSAAAGTHARHWGPLTIRGVTIKERLHKLVDELSDGEADAALRYIAQRRADPVIAAFRDAPVDDEPVTSADEQALAEAHADRDAGVARISFEEIKRRHGQA